MSNSLAEQNNFRSGIAEFTTTHWTVVSGASEPDTQESMAALEVLCRTYWYPLYAFVRRKGHEAHDAQDLTQEFFTRLLQKGYLRAVDRKKGKFRSFLLAALENFLANEWRKSKAQKRGGGASVISLDDDSAEQQYAQLAAGNLSAEKLFEQQWASTLLDQVVKRLRQEYVLAGKEHLFSELKIFLTGEKNKVAYAELAKKLGTSEPALKMTVSRMRRRYGELLRAEIANTVARPEDVDEELRALFSALSN